MATQSASRRRAERGSPAGQLAREVSALQAALLAKLREEMDGGDVEPFADAAQRLAEEFGSVTATAVDAALRARRRAGAGAGGAQRRASTGPATCAAGSTS